MSPNRPYAKVVSHGRYVAFQMAEVAIPRNWSPTSCGWSPNYDHRPLHPQRKAFDCHAFDGIRGKGASRLRQTQHFSELSEASAPPTPVHKVLRQFTLARYASPGQYQPEMGGYVGNAA
jgi:hypothetical protein